MKEEEFSQIAKAEKHAREREQHGQALKVVLVRELAEVSHFLSCTHALSTISNFRFFVKLDNAMKTFEKLPETRTFLDFS